MNEEEIFDNLSKEFEEDLKKPVNPDKLDCIEIGTLALATGLSTGFLSDLWYAGVIIGILTIPLMLRFYYLGALAAFSKSIKIHLYYGSK